MIDYQQQTTDKKLNTQQRQLLHIAPGATRKSRETLVEQWLLSNQDSAVLLWEDYRWVTSFSTI